ncbi:hypothetical protein HK105_206729 [Polyrhizophydium stewartii]|uniref:Uncharacterized protein n=1 Tax=Polyrhizophydium stewartii TaxID=2732419 RepID=A0ABR4N2M6_9FUNG
MAAALPPDALARAYGGVLLALHAAPAALARVDRALALPRRTGPHGPRTASPPAALAPDATAPASAATDAAAAAIAGNAPAAFACPEDLAAFLRACPDLAALVPFPRPPALPADAHVVAHVDAAQSFIESLSYNYIGEPFFVIKKTSSVRNLMRLAQDMIHHALPIKCLEAVIIGIHLTMKLDTLTRMNVSFKSECEGHTHRHIVLVLKLGDKWGAMGLSRRRDLMNKDIKFSSLSDLMLEYRICYERNLHTLVKIKLGLPATHNATSNERIVWKHTSVRLGELPWETAAKEIDAHARSLRLL